jgi:hypothetical protein
MSPIDPEVPEADALEQAQPVVDPGPAPVPSALGLAFEVPEADAWDQAQEVPIDEDEAR